MIARTGYIVASIAYVIFLTLDWMRPGFVSNFLSPHIFLLAAIVFGVLWARHSQVPTPASFLRLALLFLPLSILLAIFTWSEGRAFGDWRILVTLVAFVSPWFVIKQLTSQK